MKVMLLIDADNVSVEVIEATVAHLLAEFGALHGRRAYCNAESALKHQQLFKRLGIRPMVNLAAGKNSTDIALAVDAIELVMRERPEVLAIASSDSDFAPLVTRVREKGCRVLGFGQQGKTGEATVALYDDFKQFSAKGQPAPAAPPARKRATAKKAAAAEPAPAPVPAPEPLPEPLPAPAPRAPAQAPSRPRRKQPDEPAAKSAAHSAAKPATKPEAPAAPGLGRPEEVARILLAAPELSDHRAHELNEVAQSLRAAGVLGKRQSSTKLLRKHAAHFELTPTSQPHKVRLRP